MSQGTIPNHVVAALARELDAAGVAYCHWKSNTDIDRAVRAETDLDLLVGRSHVRRFREVLYRTGFTRVEKQRAGRVPGTEDFLAFDAEGDRFVHVHAHYQLVLGHDRTKNYRVPIEAPFLDSASPGTTVLPVPAVEFEYVVFVIRMVLKYAILDEIVWKALRGGARSEPKASEREEFAQLDERVDPKAVAGVLENHLPFLDRAVFDGAVEYLRHGASLRRRAEIARSVMATFQPYARMSPVADLLTRSWRRILVSVRHRTGTTPRFRPSAGGALIAVMGGDGAGKSTALEALERWLAEDFDLRQVHLGKPDWSLTTYAVRGTLKVGRIAGAVGRRRAARDAPADRPDFPGYRPILWHVCTARDRYLTFRRARRYVNRGGIVLSDRYPHPALRLMDRPQIARLVDGAATNEVVDRLIEIEDRYHRRIGPAELLIVLRLDPELAVQRKVTEPSHYVRERSGEMWDIDWSDTSVHEVDASRSKEAVAAEIKAIIWSYLS